LDPLPTAEVFSFRIARTSAALALTAAGESLRESGDADPLSHVDVVDVLELFA
jgi:hypothetical protein